MPNIELIDSYADDLTTIRRDVHAHPEIGFEEHRTSGIVAEKLAQWGIEVHRGVGGTGVVGLLKGKGGGSRRIGLRADTRSVEILAQPEALPGVWSPLPARSSLPGAEDLRLWWQAEGDLVLTLAAVGIGEMVGFRRIHG